MSYLVFGHRCGQVLPKLFVSYFQAGVSGYEGLQGSCSLPPSLKLREPANVAKKFRSQFLQRRQRALGDLDGELLHFSVNQPIRG